MSVTFNWCKDKTKLATCNKQVVHVSVYRSKMWYLNGELHRENGPAVEWVNGYKAWYYNGKVHRENGHAVEYANGSKEWYLNGKYYSSYDYFTKLKQQNALFTNVRRIVKQLFFMLD